MQGNDVGLEPGEGGENGVENDIGFEEGGGRGRDRGKMATFKHERRQVNHAC